MVDVHDQGEDFEGRKKARKVLEEGQQEEKGLVISTYYN